MRCLSSSPLIVNCIFRDNYAENKGGGIYGEGSSAVVRNCLFLRNTGSMGGGMDFLGVSRPRIEGCQFVKNTVGGMGGAVSGEENAEITVVGSTMEENTAGDGGGVAAGACRILLEDCSITDCVADFGGALSCISSTIIVTGCTLSGDSARVWGGAMACIAGSLLVSGTTVSGNFALQEGGAVQLLGATAMIDSCEISGNSSGESKSWAGGIYMDAGSALSMHRSRISGNDNAVYFDSPGGPPGRNADATDNWWGDDSGPYHPILNPAGLGDRVSDYVDFVPWDGMTPVFGAGSDPIPPAAFLANFPNPFQQETDISFAVGSPGPVRLSIYDVGGRLVRTLVRPVSSAGRFSIRWDGTAGDGTPAPSGVYFCRMENASETAVKKLLLLR